MMLTNVTVVVKPPKSNGTSAVLLYVEVDTEKSFSEVAKKWCADHYEKPITLVASNGEYVIFFCDDQVHLVYSAVLEF